MNPQEVLNTQEVLESVRNNIDLSTLILSERLNTIRTLEMTTELQENIMEFIWLVDTNNEETHVFIKELNEMAELPECVSFKDIILEIMEGQHQLDVLIAQIEQLAVSHSN